MKKSSVLTYTHRCRIISGGSQLLPNLLCFAFFCLVTSAFYIEHSLIMTYSTGKISHHQKQIVYVKQIIRYHSSCHFVGLCGDKSIACAWVCSCNGKEEVDKLGIMEWLDRQTYPFVIDVGILSLSCGILLDYILCSVCGLWHGLEWTWMALSTFDCWLIVLLKHAFLSIHSWAWPQKCSCTLHWHHRLSDFYTMSSVGLIFRTVTVL